MLSKLISIFLLWFNFLVHLDQIQVNYCHHLASVVCCLSYVVCKLFTFPVSSPKPLRRLEPGLAGMFLRWSFTKLLFFVLVGYSIWLPGPIMCSDWLKFQRSSSLKLINWLNPNCKRMIIGMSFTKFLFFYADRKSKMATIAGHSFYIGPIVFFYSQVNNTGSWEPLVIFVNSISGFGYKTKVLV